MQKLLFLLMDNLGKNQTTVWSIISAVPLHRAFGIYHLVAYMHHVVIDVLETMLVLAAMVRWFVIRNLK